MRYHTVLCPSSSRCSNSKYLQIQNRVRYISRNTLVFVVLAFYIMIELTNQTWAYLLSNMIKVIAVIFLLSLYFVSSCYSSVALQPIFLSLVTSSTRTQDIGVMLTKTLLWNGVISQSVADDGYDDLLAIYRCDDSFKDGVQKKTTMTKKDIQQDSAKLLYTTEARMNTVVDLLEEFVCNVN